jgi:hypothetical protein
VNRLRRYFNELMNPGKTEEHRVAVQPMRTVDTCSAPSTSR